MNFLGSHCGREYIAKNLPLAIFAVMTGVEEVGLENSEICSPINGCGCSLWWETCTHTAAEWKGNCSLGYMWGMAGRKLETERSEGLKT